MGSTAQQCILGLFQDSDFAGDLEYSKSTSGGLLCIFGSHTFVSISSMRKKQTSVSHSSTESEIISLDAGLRMDGIPALDLWDLGMKVLHFSSNNQRNPKRMCRENLLHDTPRIKQTKNQFKTSTKHNNLELCNVDYVSSNGKSSQSGAMLYIFEHYEHCAFFGSHTFVPKCWMCKKQTSFSHSSTESEIIALDAGLRLGGIPALDLFDLIVADLGNTNQSNNKQGDLLMSKTKATSGSDQ